MTNVVIGVLIMILAVLLLLYGWARIDLARNVSHVCPPPPLPPRRRAF